MSAVTIDDLHAAGLLAGPGTLLTDHAGEVARRLEAIPLEEVAVLQHEIAEDWAADLVLSVNGLSR